MRELVPAAQHVRDGHVQAVERRRFMVADVARVQQRGTRTHAGLWPRTERTGTVLPTAVLG
jgi:hypothetical protein